MKKMFFLAATAALALSSCTSDEIVASQTVEDGAVVFDAYAGRANRATNASTNPIVEAAGLANAGGFGVFAYEHGKTAWDVYRASNTYPNFFYNQNVYAASAVNGTATDIKTSPYLENASVAAWGYAPIKYFSNNEGAQHSFFAYAPYDKSAKVVFTTEGPAIRYVAGEDSYDLLWALPTLNLKKTDIHDKINFDFKHALSKVSFKATTFVDDVHPGTSHGASNVAANTDVVLRSIKFVGNVPSKGLLSLTNGQWKIEASEESAYEFCPAKGFTFSNSTHTKDDLSVDNMVIPTDAATKVKVQVVYDVITTDAANPKNSSTITNTVTSQDEFELVAGTAYKFCLDLGLTSVKFTADVADWDDVTNKEVDLPNNHKAEALTLTDDLSGKGAPESTALAFGDSQDQYKYENGKLCKMGSSDWVIPSLTVDKVYAKSGVNTLYLFIKADGTATEFKNVMGYQSSTGKYIVWEESTFSTAEKTPKTVKSIVPDSQGKLYKTDGSDAEVVDNDVLLCGGKLYIWK